MDHSLVEIIKDKYNDNSRRLIYGGFIYFAFDKDFIYELVLKLVEVKHEDVVKFKWLPGARIGFVKYHKERDGKRSVDIRYFNVTRFGQDTLIDADWLPCSWLNYHGKTNRLQFVDKIVNLDKVKSREDVYELFGYCNKKQIDKDLNVIAEWNKLREDIVKMIAARGFYISTEIASIMDVDKKSLLKIVKKLRKDNIVPESKYSNNKKSK
jgi:hypothetical protein